MRRLIMSRLIWIYAICKSLFLSPMAVKELIFSDKVNQSTDSAGGSIVAESRLGNGPVRGLKTV